MDTNDSRIMLHLHLASRGIAAVAIYDTCNYLADRAVNLAHSGGSVPLEDLLNLIDEIRPSNTDDIKIYHSDGEDEDGSDDIVDSKT